MRPRSALVALLVFAAGAIGLIMLAERPPANPTPAEIEGSAAPVTDVPARGDPQPAVGSGDSLVVPIPGLEPPRSLLVDEAHDLTGDGAPERVRLFVDAQRGARGQLQWDDGQRWALHVRAGAEDYPLFDEYVQIGRVHFWIVDQITSDAGAVPRILLLRETGAGVELRSYRFVEGRGFLARVEHMTSGNVVFTSPDIQ